MLPDKLLLHRREGDAVVPRFLEPVDAAWLEEMLVRRDRAIGRPQLELEAILAGDDPFPKRRLVARVLAGLGRPQRQSALEPSRARAALFGAATEARSEGGSCTRERALAIAAERSNATPAEVEASLFADLPGERRVAPLAAPVSPEALRHEVNAALAAGFLLRAVRVTVTTGRDPLPLVRHARGTGLLAERRTGGVIVLSGPFALFRHTALYGRALAGILPALARLGSFTADVEFLLRGTPGRFVFDESAPLFAGESVRTPPSPLARLVREIQRRAPGWAAIADPEPLSAVDGTPLDADLLVVPAGGGAGWRVEILRFWTAAIVRQRLDLWAGARADACLLLDDARNGADEPPPVHPSVILFHTRPRAEPLLERITAAGTEGA